MMNLTAISGVYKITNTITGKCYVGSSKNIALRIKEHKRALNSRRHQNKHLENSWFKYGHNNFLFEVLLFCDAKNTRFYEQKAIDVLSPEYNQSKSAFSGIPFGASCTEEHKQKISTASKRHWTNPEYRQKVQLAIQNSMTEEEKNARKLRTQKLWSNSEYRAKAVNSRKGNQFAKGYVCTPEQIENRKRAARISNIKRYYGDNWKIEYIRRYPGYAGDVDGK